MYSLFTLWRIMLKCVFQIISPLYLFSSVTCVWFPQMDVRGISLLVSPPISFADTLLNETFSVVHLLRSCHLSFNFLYEMRLSPYFIYHNGAPDVQMLSCPFCSQVNTCILKRFIVILTILFSAENLGVSLEKNVHCE